MSNLTDTDGLFRQAKRVRAYIRITAEMGPSAQLLAFINHDGQLGEEIGLEGFENLSLQTQHEILLSRLNPDKLEAIALEGLADLFYGSNDKIKKRLNELQNKSELYRPERDAKINSSSAIFSDLI